MFFCHSDSSGMILGLSPANERRRYKVTPSLIGWTQTYNQPCSNFKPFSCCFAIQTPTNKIRNGPSGSICSFAIQTPTISNRSLVLLPFRLLQFQTVLLFFCHSDSYKQDTEWPKRLDLLFCHSDSYNFKPFSCSFAIQTPTISNRSLVLLPFRLLQTRYGMAQAARSVGKTHDSDRLWWVDSSFR